MRKEKQMLLQAKWEKRSKCRYKPNKKGEANAVISQMRKEKQMLYKPNEKREANAVTSQMRKEKKMPL